MVRSKLAIVSFIISIIGLIINILSWVIGFWPQSDVGNVFVLMGGILISGIIGIIVIIMALTSLKKINQDKLQRKRYAIVALVIGIILVLQLIYFLIGLLVERAS